ncbi:hypothetical protein [Nocardia wallacei]|uniref:hypothetical protein n=1 Tax=Nocardia wallacei TaxID=480035 RepID=UPI002457ED06|nr:hypothetical protein [Nocardia wallacei]
MFRTDQCPDTGNGPDAPSKTAPRGRKQRRAECWWYPGRLCVASYSLQLSATDASPQQIDAAIAVNEDARLDTLKFGLLLAAVSATAVVPAARLPNYRPGEIPDPAPTD